MDRIELVGMGGNDAPLDRLLEPRPLKHRRLEDRGRRIRIVFQQFCRSPPVETEVEPAVEAGLVAVPAFADQRPEGFRNLQSAQNFLVVDRAGDEFEAHRVDLAGRRLDLIFDLLQRERIAGALIPIAFAVDGVKIKTGFVRRDAPVLALGAGKALHGSAAIRRHGRDRHGRESARAADAARRRNRHS